MSTTIGTTPQGDVQALGIPDSQDYPRLVYCAPYFQQVPLAELIEPSVQESVEALLPSLVPPYVQNAADAAVQQLAVLLTGSSMSGPLMLSPLMPTADTMAATKAYVDAMVATAGVPEVPAVPVGQTWARQTGQWIPLDPSGGNFLPLTGGTMQGQINMSGYAINNLAALPNMPNGAAPANWVLQQIASVSLYQGTWNMDTYTPDLTNPATHVNGYTWIAITASTSGVVIGPAIPGLQGQTVFNGDTIIWSNIQGQFNRIHSGGLSLAEAQALFLPFTGGTMTGPLLAYANPSETMEVATMGWVQSLIPTGGIIPEAPTDGQLYGRNGLTKVWLPVLPLAGGVMTGPILLSGNATNALSPVPLQQLTSTLSASYLALAGGTMSGPIVLSGNASANLNPTPLQQVNAMLAGYLPISGGTLTGPITAPAGSTIAGYVPLAGNVQITGNLALGIPLPASIEPPNVTYGSQILGFVSGFWSQAWNCYQDGTNWRRLNAQPPYVANVNPGNSVWALYGAAAGAAGSVAAMNTLISADLSGNFNAQGYIRTTASTSAFGLLNVLNPILAVVSMENYQGGNTMNLANGAAAGTGQALMIETYNNVTNFFIGFQWGASGVGAINTNGAETFYNTTSDGQLKTGVRPMAPADTGPILDQIEPVWFQWSHDVPVEAQGDQPGFVAQDMHSIYPWAVRQGHGAPGDDDFRPWSADSSKLIPVLVAEIKALRARAAALEAR